MADMYDQWVEARPLFHLKDSCDADTVESIGAEAVNSFSGKRDYLSLFERRYCPPYSSRCKTVKNLSVDAHILVYIMQEMGVKAATDMIGQTRCAGEASLFRTFSFLYFKGETS